MGLRNEPASFDTVAARHAQDDVRQLNVMVSSAKRVSNHANSIGAVLLALALTACGAAPPAAPTPEQAALLRPADPRLSELYVTSCKACHTIAESGAPMVHDAAAWGPRWKQGLPVLVDHSIQGFNAMPAGGQCATCTPADLEALIRFMSDHEESAK